MPPIHSCGGYGAFFLFFPSCIFVDKALFEATSTSVFVNPEPVPSTYEAYCGAKKQGQTAKHMNDLTNHQSQPVTVYSTYNLLYLGRQSSAKNPTIVCLLVAPTGALQQVG